MRSLKEIIDENNYSVSFPIMGQTLIIAPKRNIYNQIRIKYSLLAVSAVDTFKDYLSQLNNMDEFIACVPNIFVLALEEGLNEIARDAISVGYYSLNSNVILSECLKGNYFDAFKNAFKKYEDADYRICSNLASSIEYNEMKKQTRPRWTSVTYGGTALDAWMNQLKVGTMNAIEGAAYSARNSVSNAATDSEAKAQRKALFNDKKNRDELIAGVRICAINLHLVIAKIVTKNCRLPLDGWVTSKDSSNAGAIYNNIMKLNLPIGQQKQFVLKVLELNPYTSDYYVGFLKKFLDEGKELLDIANFFNVNGIANHISKIFLDYTRSIIGTTPDELIQCRERIYGLANELSIKPGYLESSLVIIGQHGSDILLRYAKGNIGTTEEDAFKCKNYIQYLAEKMQLEDLNKREALDFVNAKIEKMDHEYRTIDGNVIESREEAYKLRNDISRYNDILNYDGEFIFRYELTQHIEKIKSLSINQKLVEKYIHDFQNKLDEFDKLCKKAARHECRSAHNNLPFWNGDILSMGIQYAVLLYLIIATIVAFVKSGMLVTITGIIILLFALIFIFVYIPKEEKEIWNKVTHNGQYRLSDIMSDSVTNVNLSDRKAANNLNVEKHYQSVQYSRYCQNCRDYDSTHGVCTGPVTGSGKQAMQPIPIVSVSIGVLDTYTAKYIFIIQIGSDTMKCNYKVYESATSDSPEESMRIAEKLIVSKISAPTKVILRPKVSVWRNVLKLLIIAVTIIALLIIIHRYFSVSGIVFSAMCICTGIVYFAVNSKRLLLTSIILYQKYAPEIVRSSCLFEPCCSEYMKRSIEKYGVWTGVRKGVKRIFRCRYPNGGIDEP